MCEEKRGILIAGRAGGKEGMKGMGKGGKAKCFKRDDSLRRRKMLVEGNEQDMMEPIIHH